MANLDDVLDPVWLAEQIRCRVERHATGDDLANAVREEVHRLFDFLDGECESGPTGVDGADDGLVVQDDVLHDLVERQRYRRGGRRDAGEDEYAVWAERLSRAECDGSDAHRLVDDVDGPDGRGNLVQRCVVGGNVRRAKLADVVRATAVGGLA